MLNVGALHEGFVLDHIKAGKAMTIYHDLKLDKLDCTVAIIKNAKSNKMGVKDIIKVECPIENLDLDILGFIDHNITVNIIKDEKIVGASSFPVVSGTEIRFSMPTVSFTCPPMRSATIATRSPLRAE